MEGGGYTWGDLNATWRLWKGLCKPQVFMLEDSRHWSGLCSWLGFRGLAGVTHTFTLFLGAEQTNQCELSTVLVPAPAALCHQQGGQAGPRVPGALCLDREADTDEPICRSRRLNPQCGISQGRLAPARGSRDPALPPVASPACHPALLCLLTCSLLWVSFWSQGDFHQLLPFSLMSHRTVFAFQIPFPDCFERQMPSAPTPIKSHGFSCF